MGKAATRPGLMEDLDDDDQKALDELNGELGMLNNEDPNDGSKNVEDDEVSPNNEDARLNSEDDEHLEVAEITEEEREAIRQRRREERKNRKEYARQRQEQFRREISARDERINQLQEQIDQIQRRNTGFDMANIDSQLQSLNSAYLHQQSIMAKATENQDGESAAAATDRMLQIRDHFNRLQATKQAMVRGQNATQPLDNRVIQRATEWRGKNPWYDPSGNDEDSRIALVIDDQLNREGWSPSTDAYWAELDSRLKKRLPHRFERGTTQLSARTRSPVGGSNRSSGAGAQGKQGLGLDLSKERIDAMKAGGLWDDPEKRKKAIAEFKAYDKRVAEEGGA